MCMEEEADVDMGGCFGDDYGGDDDDYCEKE
jgi:hypothetical protein